MALPDSAAREAVARMLPAPRTVERLPGAFRLDAAAGIRVATGSPAEQEAARVLAARLAERIGLELRIADGSTPGITVRETAEASETSAEAFELRVDERGAQLTASGAAGLRYGGEAFAQLASTREVPAVHIEDAPALRRRGFLLDISRGRVPRTESVKQLIELLARLRYNELLLYTEHTFVFEKHPDIGAGSGGYTASEIRELDAHARRHGVELVPCLQTFGHMRKILEQERYRELAESETLWSLSPEAPGTYPLLEEMLGEYLPNFASGWAHINCDEPVDLGKGRSAKRAERDGLAALFAGHVNRVAAMVRQLGKQPMIWADVLADHPDALDLLDEDTVLCDWWYEPDHDFDRVERFQRAGRDFLTGAGTSSWTSLFPRLDTALPNISGHARAAKRFGASGMIVTDWGDGGHYNFFSGSLYPIAAGAEAMWGDETRPENELETAFSEHVVGDASGFAGEFAARLGRLHDTGFAHFNHSPLKTVFFETKFRRSKKTPKAEALRRTLDELRRLANEAEQHGLPDAQVGREWSYALDASVLAAERGLLMLAFRSAVASGEKNQMLAAELGALADRQRALGRRFREVWLRAYRPEGIEIALTLHRRAVAALRRAARVLRSQRSRMED